MEEKFSFNVPIDIVKASDESNEEWRIGGYASTSDQDRQGDFIIQNGLDYSDFVNYGFFNYDHHNDQILGYPDKSKCKVNSKGFYVEGTLLKNIPLAKKMWDTALALKNSGAPRKLGFSVEGKVLAKNPQGKIIKAKVYNVAITANPVNTSCTWDALVKAFTDNEEEVLNKSLSTGDYAQAGSVESKTGGAALAPESLDNAIKTLSLALDDDGAELISQIKDILGKRKIKKSELTLYFMLTKDLNLSDSKSLVNKLL